MNFTYFHSILEAEKYKCTVRVFFKIRRFNSDTPGGIFLSIFITKITFLQLKVVGDYQNMDFHKNIYGPKCDNPRKNTIIGEIC